MNTYFKKGQTVLFQGDSVTDCQRNRDDAASLGGGYASKVANIYTELFAENNVKFVNKGVSGNRVKDILDRYDSDIKDVAPDFISILIGINDVWRRYDQNDATSVEDFTNSYETLLKKIIADFPNIKIMIVEPFLLHSADDKDCWHEDFDPKLQAIRKLAMQYADYLLPTDGIMAREGCKFGPEALAADDVHPTQLGHSIIATEYLKLLEIL